MLPEFILRVSDTAVNTLERLQKVFRLVNGATQKHNFLTSTGLAVLAAGFLSFWQRHPTLNDADSFYHAKMGILLAAGTLSRDFSWLPLTIFQGSYTDHHFLYHVLLAPFVGLFDPLVGLKISIVVLGTLSILVFYWALRALKVSSALWWTTLLFISFPFLVRLSFAKALPVSLALYLIGLVALRRGRWWFLFIVSFLYVWTYAGWPLLPVTVLVFSFLSIIFNRRTWLKAVTIGLAALGGSLAGILANPYFPQNIAFYKAQILSIALTPANFAFVGVEWFPYPLREFLVSNAPILIALIVVSSIFLSRRLEGERIVFLNHKEKTFLATMITMTLGLFAATLFARRYVEYFAPLAVFTTAFSYMIFKRQPKKRFPLVGFKEKFPVWFLSAIFLEILIVILFAGRGIVEFDNVQRNAHKLRKLQPVSSWMSESIPADSLIMNLNWDEFPMLFYYADSLRYTMGLDPRLIKEADLRLPAWESLFRGTAYDPARIIKDDFEASYILVSITNKEANQLFRNNEFPILYEDAEAILYEVPD